MSLRAVSREHTVSASSASCLPERGCGQLLGVATGNVSNAQVCFSTELDSQSGAFGWGSITKRVGGEVHIADGAVDLRVLIDHSAVEIFTGCGQALTTR